MKNKYGQKIVFVSVPMAGKDDAMIRRAIQVALAEYLHTNGLTIRDVSATNNHWTPWGIDEVFPEGTNESVAYLGRALRRMAAADVVIFAKNWEDARGCRIEHKVCEDYGIDIFECNGLAPEDIPV